MGSDWMMSPGGPCNTDKLSATNQIDSCCIRPLGAFQVPDRNIFSQLTKEGKRKKWDIFQCACENFLIDFLMN